jgi:hypothetical protein
MPTQKTPEWREELRARLLSPPDPVALPACEALLAEIEQALEQAEIDQPVDKVDSTAT